MRDVVGSLFHRLGMVGVILVASALIFGALASGVIVHRLQSPAASSKHAPAANGGDQSQTPTHNSQANDGGQETRNDEQDKDA